MDHAGAMGGVERQRDFDGISDRLSEREAARARAGPRSSPVQKFHDEKIAPVVGANVVQRPNMRMLQGSNGSRLTFEAMARIADRSRFAPAAL